MFFCLNQFTIKGTWINLDIEQDISREDLKVMIDQVNYFATKYRLTIEGSRDFNTIFADQQKIIATGPCELFLLDFAKYLKDWLSTQSDPRCSVYLPNEPEFIELQNFRNKFKTHYKPGCLGGHFGWFRSSPLTKESAIEYAEANPDSATNRAVLSASI